MDKIDEILKKYRSGVEWLSLDEAPAPKQSQVLTHSQTIDAVMELIQEANKAGYKSGYHDAYFDLSHNEPEEDDYPNYVKPTPKEK